MNFGMLKFKSHVKLHEKVLGLEISFLPDLKYSADIIRAY